MSPVTADATLPSAARPPSAPITPLDPGFLAALAHELRNPLAPLVNALFLLRAKVTGDVDASWALDIVDRQLGDLRALLDDTSDIARIMRGRLQRSGESVDVAEAANTAAQAVHAMLAARHQSARVTAAYDHGLMLAGDAGRLTRAIVALLLYTARAVSQGDVIDIRVAADGNQFEIVIAAADGAAPTDDVARFNRVAAPPYDASIGVAYAQIVAQWHDGSLDFAADPTGRPRFQLRLPVASPASGG